MYNQNYVIFSEESFCLDCVKERCRNLQFSSRLADDQKFFVKALKLSNERYLSAINPR